MFLGEKTYLISWQLIDDQTQENVGEETIAIRVWADSAYGFEWDPVSHSTDVGGKLETSTCFIDSLGKDRMKRAKRWFELNRQRIECDEPEFQAWRRHCWAENEADRGLARSQAL
jgi:hypothetical protein